MGQIAPNDAAFPGIETARDPRDVGFYGYPGMTIRLKLASEQMAAILAGYCSDHEVSADKIDMQKMAGIALRAADALIDAYNETQPRGAR